MLTTMNFNISEVKYSACAPLYPFPSFQKSGKFEMGSRDRETSELVPAIPREFCFALCEAPGLQSLKKNKQHSDEA